MNMSQGSLLDDLALPPTYDPETIGRIVGRYPESAWLDMLARRASRGRLNATQLVRSVREGAVPRETTALAIFAWLTATIATSPDDLRIALDLYEAAFSRSDRTPRVPQAVYNTWLRALAVTGELASGRPGPPEDRVLEADWWAVHTDLLNPVVHDGSEEAWLSAFNTPFTDAGLEPLTLDSSEGSLLSRLEVAPLESVDGPLVSVVMPVFNPDPALVTAVRSIINQTWGNLEILVVDDASVEGVEYFDEVASLDKRVRVLHAPTNGGAYKARNLGLASATGEFLTFQDADDFSHPQRLERHALELRDTGRIAAVGRGVRATDDLMITTLGFRHISINLSSLMFRRQEVLQRLGMYDPVRRGADSEFSYRIQSSFGRDAVARLGYPLAVLRLSPGSLSGGEVGLLQRHPARVSYRAASQGWHDDQHRRGRNPRVFPPNRAPFPAPSHIRGTFEGAEHSRFDVLLLATLEAGVGFDSAGVVEALSSSGARIAVREHFGPQAAIHRLRESQNSLGHFLATGAAHWALPSERVSAPITFVHDPLSLLAMPPEDIDSDRIVLVLETMLSPETIRVIDGRLRLRGRSVVEWLPATSGIADHVRRVHPSARVLEPGWWRTPTVSRARTTLRHGPVGILDPILTPGSTPPAELLPADAPLWGFGRSFPDTEGSVFTRIPAQAARWGAFLTSIGTLIHPRTPSITPVMLDAWHSGTLVLAPPGMEPLLGDKALYPTDVDQLLDDLREDPTAANEAIRAGQSYCDTHVAPMSIISTFTTLALDVHE